MDINDNYNEGKANFKWSPGDIRCLINLFIENSTSFDKYSKKKVWIDIANHLSSTRNKTVTAEQCDGKWKGLKSMYKHVKDHNNISGNSHKKWEYFELMDEVLNKRPEVNPPATCSSSDPDVTVNRSNASGEDYDFVDLIEERSIVTPPSSLNRKRKTNDDLKSAEKSKIHTEKMARTDKFLDLFQKLIEKI